MIGRQAGSSAAPEMRQGPASRGAAALTLCHPHRGLARVEARAHQCLAPGRVREVAGHGGPGAAAQRELHLVDAAGRGHGGMRMRVQVCLWVYVACVCMHALGPVAPSEPVRPCHTKRCPSQPARAPGVAGQPAVHKLGRHGLLLRLHPLLRLGHLCRQLVQQRALGPHHIALVQLKPCQVCTCRQSRARAAALVVTRRARRAAERGPASGGSRSCIRASMARGRGRPAALHTDGKPGASRRAAHLPAASCATAGCPCPCRASPAAAARGRLGGTRRTMADPRGRVRWRHAARPGWWLQQAGATGAGLGWGWVERQPNARQAAAAPAGPAPATHQTRACPGQPRFGRRTSASGWPSCRPCTCARCPRGPPARACGCWPAPPAPPSGRPAGQTPAHAPRPPPPHGWLRQRSKGGRIRGRYDVSGAAWCPNLAEG